MFSRTLSVASVVRRHCRSLSIKPSFTQLPSSSAPILCRHLSLKSPSEKEVPASEERDDTPNIIYYGLYTTLCYSGVYVGTLSAIYVALSSGVLSAETFDIDQMESVAKLQKLVNGAVTLEDGPQFQLLADTAMVNRLLKVPRVFMTTGVALVMANKFGMDLDEDEDGHKKIFFSIFALSLLEMEI